MNITWEILFQFDVVRYQKCGGVLSRKLFNLTQYKAEVKTEKVIHEAKKL